MAVFSPAIGVFPSLLFSSILFGICHLYQGWQNVLRTAIVGMILGTIYIFTESLLIVIVLHALIDIYGGLLGYVVNTWDQDSVLKHSNKQSSSATTNN